MTVGDKMKGVRTACISGFNNLREATLFLNLSVLQYDGEPWGENCYWVTAELHFDYKGMCIFTNTRRVQVDTWKSLKSLVMKEFVEEMYRRISIDFMPKQEVIDIVDRMFKNDKSHSTPLMLAAHDGGLHTVH